MLKSLHDDPASWAIEEGDAAFRIVDAAGRILADIPFGHRSTSNLSKSEAKRMAQEMVTAGDHLVKAGAVPKPRPGT